MNDALCVCELADILEMPQSTVSSHVQIIRKANMLESEKMEKWTYFRIAEPYLVLLNSILEAFDDTISPADAKRAELRLAKRENSCCPGPNKLASRHQTTTRP